MYLVFKEHFSKVEVFFNKSMKTQFCEVKIREDTIKGCYLLGFTAKSREDVSRCRVILYFLCELRAIFVGQYILVLIWLSVYCWVKSIVLLFGLFRNRIQFAN